MSKDARDHKTYGKNHRAQRLPDWDYSLPYPYHIVLTTFQRRPLFTALPTARTVIEAIHAQIAYTHYRLYAFCIMPDHVHVLCQPPEYETKNGGYNPPLQQSSPNTPIHEDSRSSEHEGASTLRPAIPRIDLCAFVQHLKIKATSSLKKLNITPPSGSVVFTIILCVTKTALRRSSITSLLIPFGPGWWTITAFIRIHLPAASSPAI
jgi:hypothetical protein